MEGKFDEMKGWVEEAAGDLTDNEHLKREGKVDKASGKAKSKLDEAKEWAADKVDEVRDRFKR